MGTGGGMGAMVGAMSGAMSAAMKTKIVDRTIENPSMLQKQCYNKKIPDFLSEYVKKYGKDDIEKVYALHGAYFLFVTVAIKSLDEQVKSV